MFILFSLTYSLKWMSFELETYTNLFYLVFNFYQINMNNKIQTHDYLVIKTLKNSIQSNKLNIIYIILGNILLETLYGITVHRDGCCFPCLSVKQYKGYYTCRPRSYDYESLSRSTSTTCFFEGSRLLYNQIATTILKQLFLQTGCWVFRIQGLLHAPCSMILLLTGSSSTKFNPRQGMASML